MVILSFVILGQNGDSIKLADCLRIAGERSVLNRQISNNSEIIRDKIKNLNTNWFPSVGFNAQALYNSETVNFSDIVKNTGISFPALPLDQYKIWADINQQIYDGGAVKAQKAIEKAGYEVDMQQTEAELLGLRQQVSQVYFSLLLTRKSADIIQVSLEELTERKKVVKSGVDHGIVLPDNLLALEAQEISLQQKLTELNLTMEQMIKTLSVLMDSTLSIQVVPADPVDIEVSGDPSGRPEFQMFEKQKERLLANQKLVSSSDLPKFYAFSQAAYGRPGYNLASSNFHTFYSVGLGMKWNFLNYGDNKRQKKILELQKDQVDVKKQRFNDQLDIQLLTEKSNIEKYDALLKQDEQILQLRKAIASASLAKLNNGVITSMDYLSDMNAEILAKLQFENHKILKKQAAVNFMLLQDKF